MWAAGPEPIMATRVCSVMMVVGARKGADVPNVFLLGDSEDEPF